MHVIKRDGSKEIFNVDKIIRAVKAAFEANNQKMDLETLNDIEDYVNSLTEDIAVEDIQDAIEQILMDNNYKVAKKFILYRYEHQKDRRTAIEDVEFIKKFVEADNTANATIDDNSNVSNHGVGVLNAELHKSINMKTNQYLWEQKIKALYPDFNIKQFRKDITSILYVNDFSSQVLEPYCQSVSMYPFLLRGLKDLGGKSAVPKSLESYCGIYINLVFALASEVKGAIATPEFLMYFDYFAKKSWGPNYYLKSDSVITTEHCLQQKTIKNQIHQYFQQVSYSINQIAGSRGMQSPFTNFSFFDKYFFEGLFGEFVFPDGTKPTWESLKWLQEEYLHWLNQERLQCMLTFPVCSYSLLTDKEGNFMDKSSYEFVCKEYSEGNSFFTYLSNTVDSLSSCCRLQNAVETNEFSFTNGMIGVMTGSKNVITLNLNRIVQDCAKEYSIIKTRFGKDKWYSALQNYLIDILDRVYKYQKAYNELLHWAKDNHLYAAYDAGFIDLNKQYLTIGLAGLNQAAEFLGMECNDNSDYKAFCKLIFKTIKEQNQIHRTKKEHYNCEQIPAESAAIKLYNRDKKDGYWIPTDTNLYASYIFKPNDPNISILEKIKLHSEEFATNELDGGQSAHLNLNEHLSKEQYKKILHYAAKVGCRYLTFNVPNSECDECGFITKVPISECPHCHSKKITLWDRVIGYLTAIKHWSKGRQFEQKLRIYSSVNNIEK